MLKVVVSMPRQHLACLLGKGDLVGNQHAGDGSRCEGGENAGE